MHVHVHVHVRRTLLKLFYMEISLSQCMPNNMITLLSIDGYDQECTVTPPSHCISAIPTYRSYILFLIHSWYDDGNTYMYTVTIIFYACTYACILW